MGGLRLTFAILLLGPLFASASESMTAQTSTSSLATRRVFFGHQSVGGNIVGGLQALGGLRIVEGTDAAALSEPGFVHGYIGRNEDPDSKLKDFARVVRSGVGERADVAFFKFCYIDFTADTDVKALFERYRDTLAALEKEFPKTRFVHVTAPLVAVQRGWKGTLKNWMGKGAWGERENVRRHEYNELLRAAYGNGRGALFDLAKLESTPPGGGQETFERDGRVYPSLVQSYTDDAQHLNGRGSEWVARALVTFLSGLPRPSLPSPGATTP